MMTRSRACAVLLLVGSMASPSEGARLRPIQALYADDKGSGLRQPQGVACDGKAMVVVADTGNRRLVRYRIEGDRATPLGEVRLNEIPYPIKVQIGPKGDLFALDGRSRRIARISPSGEFKGYVPLAAGAAGPSVPRSFAIDRDGNLFVLDIHQARVVVLGPDGKSSRQIAFPKEPGFLSDLAVDDRDTVFAIDSVGRRVFAAKRTDGVLAPLTGPMKDDMAFPTAIAVDGQGRLFIADQNEGGVVILGTDGSFRGRQAATGWKEGQLRYPSGLCAGMAGLIAVADRENNRVQVFEVSE